MPVSVKKTIHSGCLFLVPGERLKRDSVAKEKKKEAKERPEGELPVSVESRMLS